jgi:hypothetical protein
MDAVFQDLGDARECSLMVFEDLAQVLLQLFDCRVTFALVACRDDKD